MRKKIRFSVWIDRLIRRFSRAWRRMFTLGKKGLQLLKDLFLFATNHPGKTSESQVMEKYYSDLFKREISKHG
jgi:hypothetical protein